MVKQSENPSGPQQRAQTTIHPTAIVAPGAELGVGVAIGPFCIIDGGVRIGDRTQIHASAQVLNNTTIGCDNVIHSGAILGGVPQDRKYDGQDTVLVIGDRNSFREHCTVHIGTPGGARVTEIGSDNLMMACSHVAHDCSIGDGVTLGNNVLCAGHVHIESRASVSGGSVIHQFTTVGTLSYVGGLARVTMDVPPYIIFEGRPGRPRGLNIIGLQRSDMPKEHIDALKEAYLILFRTSQTLEAGLALLESRPNLPAEIEYLIDSLRRSDQGIRGRYLETLRRNGVEMPSRRIQDLADTQDLGEAGSP